MPLLAPLLVPFFVLACAIVLVGLAQSHAAVHGTQASSGFWDWITGKTQLKALFGLVTKAGSFVASHFAAAQLRHLAKWFLAMGTLTGGMFKVEAEFAEEVVHAIERVMHRGDPRARTQAHKANRHAIHAGHAATHANAHARAIGHALDAYKARTNTRVHHLSHAVDVAIPHDIAALRARNKALERAQQKEGGAIKELEDGATKTFDWIRSHPLSAATAVFTGAVAIALTRLGWGVLRCREWQRLGRSLTCSDASILRDIFALATGILASQISLEEFIRAAQAVENEAVDALHLFIRE